MQSERSFKEAKTIFERNLIKRNIFRNDLYRLLVVVMFVWLLLILYVIEGSVLLPDTYIKQSIINRGKSNLFSVEIKNDFDIEEALRIGNAMDDLWYHFPFVREHQIERLGDLDMVKKGYFGDYVGSDVTFRAFLPIDYQEPVFFGKNGVSLLIKPVDFNVENTTPLVEDERLIYDEVYDGVLVVKVFNNEGIKDYIMLKNEGAVREFRFELNYQGGGLKQLNSGDIVFLGDNGEEKFKIDDLMVYNALQERIDQKVSYRLVDTNILELKFDGQFADVYPILIDPGIH